MATQLTVDDARQTMEAHAAAKGFEMCEKYGPHLGWAQLLQILEDRTLVRYPSKVAFDDAPLADGECAHAQANGDTPEEGFTIYIHPFFVSQPPNALRLVLYQLVLVNYGPFASSDDAEALGAAALGISKDEYYQQLCALADQLN
jgi:hypothetical protein